MGFVWRMRDFIQRMLENPISVAQSMCYSYRTYLLRPDVTSGSSILFQRPTCMYPSLHLPRQCCEIQKSSHALHNVIHGFLGSSVISVAYDSFLMVQTVASVYICAANDNF